MNGDEADLAGLRALVVALGSLRDDLVEPPDGFVHRAMVGARPVRWQLAARRVVADDRVQHAALSVGGAAVGAAAVGLIWWRRGRGRARAARRVPTAMGAEA